MEHSPSSHDSSQNPRFDPEQVSDRLMALHDREFMVKRNANPKTGEEERYEAGWVIEDVRGLPDGRIGVLITQPEQNIEKRIYGDVLLSWQPEPSEIEEDTLIRPHELERHDEQAHVEEELGEIALGASDIVPSETDMTHETELSADDAAAEARISAVLGDDGSGKNMLAETLRQAGDIPADIRMALADKEYHAELRDLVKTVLARRMSDLLAEGGHFHERVQRNSPKDLKVPDVTYGYMKRTYRSDEYVVLLALAKLDGSFDTGKERNTYDDLPADHYHQGQHRQASDALLESFMAENEPTAPERDTTDDAEIIRARQSVDTMLDLVRTNNRLNVEQLDQLEQQLHFSAINLNEMDDMTNAIVSRLHESYEVIHRTLDELARIKDGIDEATMTGMRRRHVFESAATTIRQGMDMLSMDFAYNGIGMIDRLTSESRYDANMQLEYRSRVAQLVHQMKDAQQTALSVMESVQL